MVSGFTCFSLSLDSSAPYFQHWAHWLSLNSLLILPFACQFLALLLFMLLISFYFPLLILFFTLPDSSVGKESACNAGDHGSIPGLGRSPGEGIGCPLQDSWASLLAQLVKNLPTMRETWVQFLGWEDPLEKRKSSPSSVLAWRIPWTAHGVANSRTRLSDFHFHFTLTLTCSAPNRNIQYTFFLGTRSWKCRYPCCICTLTLGYMCL